MLAITPITRLCSRKVSCAAVFPAVLHSAFDLGLIDELMFPVYWSTATWLN